MRSNHPKRNGFAMIMAIFFMIVIATLLTYMLSTSTETAKRTTNTYVNEQAQLLAKSAVEYAILRVAGQNRTASGCITTFSTQYPDSTSPIFDIRVDISYFGFGAVTGGCRNYLPVAVDTIQTAESNGTMMIDVYVSDNAGLGLSEPIRYHRRTLQKL